VQGKSQSKFWQNLIAQKQSTKNMKNICDWFTLNFYNLTAVARAKRVEPQGEMRWKLFGNIVLFLSSLFKERGKDEMDCM